MQKEDLDMVRTNNGMRFVCMCPKNVYSRFLVLTFFFRCYPIIQPNHLLGHTRTYIKLQFRNVLDLQAVRRVLLPAAKQNLAKMSVADTYAEVIAAADMGMDDEPIASKAGGGNGLDQIVDIREYDIPYTIRVAIDKGNTPSLS